MQKYFSDYTSALLCETPSAWLKHAETHLDMLLIDHAHCEKKAASTALSLIFRYPEYAEICQKLSRLAREELRHFEQVHALLQQRNIEYRHLQPGRYANELRKNMRTHDPGRLVDTLLVGALIEARSCERFAKLSALLPEDLVYFYRQLAKAEARHFQDYIELAEQVDKNVVPERLKLFQTIEADLISSYDKSFRFHSGIPENL